MLKKGLENNYEDSDRCKHSKPAIDSSGHINVSAEDEFTSSLVAGSVSIYVHDRSSFDIKA